LYALKTSEIIPEFIGISYPLFNKRLYLSDISIKSNKFTSEKHHGALSVNCNNLLLIFSSIKLLFNAIAWKIFTHKIFIDDKRVLSQSINNI
jgi:hypothetical protein